MSERKCARVLVVDDDRIVAESIAAFLGEEGYRSEWASDAEQALRVVEESLITHPDRLGHPVTVVIVDMALPGMSGLDLIKAFRQRGTGVVPIAITGYGTIESAVKAIRLGAVDYLTKPLVDEELLVSLERAVQQQALMAENTVLRQQLDARYGLDHVVGSDPRMKRTLDVIEAVAPSRTTVLMCGESGTGKSLMARAVHRRSPRRNQPFVEIACGSIPEALLESELFGHTQGAFTGAVTDRPGRFLAAHHGTIFLDEINSAPPAMQLKLLRVLQERVFEPVGSNQSVEVDVRVILASNEPLEELVAAGRFRQDLYYRINVVSIQLPPLRDRVMDIPLLAQHFLHEKVVEAGRSVLGFSEAAMDALRAYAWPGNVRELENVIERAVVLTRATRIGVEDLPPQVVDNAPPRLTAAGAGVPWKAGPRTLPLRQALEEPEKQIILAALQANAWNRQETADQLQINRTTLYKKIKQYRLEEEFGIV
jgi:DNA-binding NtrC family response regulator